MAEIVGTTAAILQMVGFLSKGINTLRHAYIAIKDVQQQIEDMYDNIRRLEAPISFIQRYMQSRPALSEFELHEIIRDVTTSCITSLTVIQNKLPLADGPAQKTYAAIKMWIRDREIEQAQKHIDGCLQNLALILPLLHIFKIDQVDATLHTISSFLKATSQYRALKDDVVSESNREALETLKINIKIRALASNMATSIAMQVNEPDLSSRKIVPRVACLDQSHTERRTVLPGRKQLEHEWEENRIALKQLLQYQLYESAVGIQRRALEIMSFIAQQDSKPWISTDEHDNMQEVLADILLQCDTEESQHEALDIFKRQLAKTIAIPNDPGTPSQPSTVQIHGQKSNVLHLKLGKVYKDIGQLDFAEDHLRTAFHAYESDDQKNPPKFKEAGEHLLELYKFQFQHSDGTQRAVRITQWRAFRREFQAALGQPITECSEAVSWFEQRNIEVYKIDQRYRFDIPDPDSGSSPLHIAVEKCDDKTVLQQVIENSDTIDTLDEDHETPLLIAVGKSKSTAIALLLKNGASIKARDKERQTVLHRSQNPQITKFLLQSRLHRASSVATDLSVNTLRRDSTSSSATTRTTGTTFSTHLQPAPLSDDDVEIDAQDVYHRTALWTACAAGRAKTVSLLLAARADPNIARHNKSPLAIAIDSKARAYLDDAERRLKIVQALVRAGADPQPGKELLRKPRDALERRILRALEGQPSPGMPTVLTAFKSFEIRDSSSGEASEDLHVLSPTSTGLLPEVDVDSTVLPDFSKPDLG